MSERHGRGDVEDVRRAHQDGLDDFRAQFLFLVGRYRDLEDGLGEDLAIQTQHRRLADDAHARQARGSRRSRRAAKCHPTGLERRAFARVAITRASVPLLACLALEKALHAAHEDAPHRAKEFWVVSEQVANAIREGKHPLAHGHVGEHFIDEVCGIIGHAAASARRAEAATFAGGKPRFVAKRRIATALNVLLRRGPRD